MPKMGESIMEATILKWLKNVGDKVELDEPILEIATDKVDSDIPSPVDGVIAEILFKEDDVVEIGTVIARITTDADVAQEATPAPPPVEVPSPKKTEEPAKAPASNGAVSSPSAQVSVSATSAPMTKSDYSPSKTTRFYSPLVRTIAQEESIPVAELDALQGTGANGRVTKKDILAYVQNRKSGAAQPVATPAPAISKSPAPTKAAAPQIAKSSPSVSGDVEIIAMDRMRKLIADHMVRSKHTSPHVTSFVEVDVTNIVEWRNKVKAQFQQTYGEKITFTPIFMEAVTKALKDFPMVNVSLDGDNIVKKNYINIGMATALPSGNLIVPVIKNADHLNLVGLAKSVNDLANRARNNKLSADEIQNGTFTLTNVGTFGNVMGTPIINQPQVAIMAVGAIRKKPAVVETEMGDLIAVRHMMFLSLSYDHRIVDGFLGGSFLKRVADYLEAFDKNRDI